MMSDRELLEMAALAAGIEFESRYESPGGSEFRGLLLLGTMRNCIPKFWNPLTDDGDALRLAVRLDLAVTPYPIYSKTKHSVLAQLKNIDDSRFEVMELHGSDPCAATRRAIVRAAAEIGRRPK